MLDQALLDRILRSPRLPTLPAIAVRILELTQDPDVRMQDLAQTIEYDQAIASKVLRTVNSSFYGLRQRCSTISQALVLLGLSTVKTLSLSFSLISSLRPEDSEEFDHVSYWRRGLYSAVAARTIAREVCPDQSDEAFLGGLLQDIGVLALYQTLGTRYASLLAAADHHRDLSRYELAELEIQHAAIGAMLAQRWRLPPELIMPIRYHERPTAAPEQFRPLVRAVGLGNLACDVMLDAEPGPALRRFRAAAAAWFGFDAAHSDDALRRIASLTAELAPLFSLGGRDLDAEAIMARAEQHLSTMTEPGDPASGDDATLCRLVSDSHEYDPLTGVLTRRAMLTRAMEMFDDAGPRIGSLAVIAIEIDRFGLLTRETSQDVADAALAETAQVLQQHLESTGAACARWDGGLFTMLLPGVDEARSVALATRIQSALARQCAQWFEGIPRPTWSAGVATVDLAGGDVPRGVNLFAAALQALDSAKKLGGNSLQVCPQRMAA